MKIIYKAYLTFILNFIILSVFAQPDSIKIKFVKTQFAEINGSLRSYKRVVKTDTAETTEGNEVVLFYNGNEIKKIQVTYYGETGKNLNEYYFFDKKLIFYFLKEYNYEVPINVDSSGKIGSANEKRYYFYNGKIFLVKVNSKETTSPTEIKKLTADTKKESEKLLHLP